MSSEWHLDVRGPKPHLQVMLMPPFCEHTSHEEAYNSYTPVQNTDYLTFSLPPITFPFLCCKPRACCTSKPGLVTMWHLISQSEISWPAAVRLICHIDPCLPPKEGNLVWNNPFFCLSLPRPTTFFFKNLPFCPAPRSSVLFIRWDVMDSWVVQ